MRRMAFPIGETADGKPLLAPVKGHCFGIHKGMRSWAFPIGETADGKPLLGWSRSWGREAQAFFFRKGERHFAVPLSASDGNNPVLGSWSEQCQPIDTYSSSYYGSSRPPNPTFDSICCFGQQMSSVIYANVIGTSTHDTSAPLYYYSPAMTPGPPYWWPSWYVPSFSTAFGGWYASRFIEDFSCVHNFDFEVVQSGTNYHYVGSYTEEFYYYLLFFGCYPIMTQVVKRLGSWTRTSIPWGVEHFTVDTHFEVGSMGGLILECYTTECDPFYHKRFIRKGDFPFDKFLTTCPEVYETVDGLNNFLVWIPESLESEPDAVCTTPPDGTGPHIEVFENPDGGETWPPS